MTHFALAGLRGRHDVEAPAGLHQLDPARLRVGPLQRPAQELRHLRHIGRPQACPLDGPMLTIDKAALLAGRALRAAGRTSYSQIGVGQELSWKSPICLMVGKPAAAMLASSLSQASWVSSTCPPLAASPTSTATWKPGPLKTRCLVSRCSLHSKGQQHPLPPSSLTSF